jgi:hypothetical protein
MGITWLQSGNKSKTNRVYNGQTFGYDKSRNGSKNIAEVDGCLAISGNSAIQKALAFPQYTPAVKPRVLQQFATLIRHETRCLREKWADLAPPERKWWVDWVNSDLPEPKGLLRVASIALLFVTKWNLTFHQEDALEFFTAIKMLEQAVIELTSDEVWKSANADADFIEASKKGFEELEAGLVSVVSPKDL